MEIIFSGKTDIGKTRSRNEDYIGQADTLNGSLFIVCDGMGGHAGGDVASKAAVETIISVFNAEMIKDIPALILKAFETANNKIREISADNPQLSGMGTTVVLLVIKNNEIYFGNLGDSRLYFFDGSDLKRLTKDHSFVQLLLDKGIISEFEAEIHPRKNEITQALGINQTIEPGISKAPMKVQRGDVFMLCSDGLYGMLSDNEILALLASSAHTLSQKCDIFIDKANNAGGTDNISIHLVEITKGNSNNVIFENGDQITRGRKSLSIKKVIPIILILLIITAGSLLLYKVFNGNKQGNITDSIVNDTTKKPPVVLKDKQDSTAPRQNTDLKKIDQSNEFKVIGKSEKSIKPDGPGKPEAKKPAGVTAKKDTSSKPIQP